MSYDPLNSQLVGARTLHGNEKRCPVCDTVKSHEEYHHHRRTVDGLEWACKPCTAYRANHSYAGTVAQTRRKNRNALERINQQVKEALS